MRTLYIAAVLLCVPVGALGETMVTSHHNAKAWKDVKASDCAAHRTLPLGSKLRVTNKRNGKSTTVIICGRGPFINTRHLDISNTAAKELGFGKSGVLRLQVERLGKVAGD